MRGTRYQAACEVAGATVGAMIGDAPQPTRLRAVQDRALARYLGRVVRPFSDAYGILLSARPVRTRDDLSRWPLSSLDDVADAGALVLRPNAARLRASGELTLIVRLLWSQLWRRRHAFNRRVLEPRFKPIHWHYDRAVPIGYSAKDLDRLGEIGRVSLELAGVGPYDVLVGVVAPGPRLTFWQLVLGTRRAGLSALFLEPTADPEEVASLAPNVLAGRSGDLLRLLEAAQKRGIELRDLHTLIAVGEPPSAATRRRLTALAGGSSGRAAVVSMWAPPGVRALWTECRAGDGFHTWPGAELLELVDPLSEAPVSPGSDGEIVWTPIGWHGTVLLRLRTGVFGGLDESPCLACGRNGPRVQLAPGLPPFARLLDDHPQVGAWQAELRTVDGSEELIVFLAVDHPGHPGPLLRELDRQLSVTQFVVMDRDALDQRLADLGDVAVVDLRSN